MEKSEDIKNIELILDDLCKQLEDINHITFMYNKITQSFYYPLVCYSYGDKKYTFYISGLAQDSVIKILNGDDEELFTLCIHDMVGANDIYFMTCANANSSYSYVLLSDGAFYKAFIDDELIYNRNCADEKITQFISPYIVNRVYMRLKNKRKWEIIDGNYDVNSSLSFEMKNLDITSNNTRTRT